MSATERNTGKPVSSALLFLLFAGLSGLALASHYHRGETLDCNAYAERFVRSVKEECLDRIIPIGLASLRRAVREFLAHYHRERNHQGLENRLIEPPSCLGTRNSSVRRRERLGGMLSYYYRLAA